MNAGYWPYCKAAIAGLGQAPSRGAQIAVAI